MDTETENIHSTNPRLRATVAVVAGLNLAYFGVEGLVALAIGSVSLLADSIDFLEDASLNLLVFLALAWSAAARASLGRLLAAIILVPGMATLWTAWTKFGSPLVPDPALLTLTGAGAMAVNFVCALLLSRHRRTGGGLVTAVFLSARNDVIANAAIIGAGLVTATVWRSGWPDLIVGLAIAAINASAAWEVWEAANRDARAHPEDEPAKP